MRCWSTCNRRSSGGGTSCAGLPPSAQDELQHQELPDPDMELVVLFVANTWMLRGSSWRSCMRVK